MFKLHYDDKYAPKYEHLKELSGEALEMERAKFLKYIEPFVTREENFGALTRPVSEFLEAVARAKALGFAFYNRKGMGSELLNIRVSEDGVGRHVSYTHSEQETITRCPHCNDIIDRSVTKREGACKLRSFFQFNKMRLKGE